MQDGNIPQTAEGLFDQFQKAQTVDDLPKPETEPALALTNDGWFEWLQGASEWTPLPSWWVQQLGRPENHVPEGYIRNLNNTLYLPPGGSIKQAIEEVDGGRIVLQRGDYQIDGPIRIPGNVVIEGQGIDSVVYPSGDSDMFVIGGQAPSSNGNTTALRDLALDTSNVNNYSSTVATFTDEETYHGGIEFLQNVVIHMYGSGKNSTAIALIDKTGSGLSAVTFGNVRLMFPGVGIRTEVNNDGFVNGNACHNIWARDPRVGIKEVINNGVIRANNWDFRLNGSENIVRVLENQGDRNRYRLFLFDLVRIPGAAITMGGNRNVLQDQSGHTNLRRWVVDSGANNRYDDMSRILTYLPQENLPYWLKPSGTGTLNGSGDETTLVAGSSRGDQFSVTSPGGLFSAWQYPWIQLWFQIDGSASNGLTSLGLAGEDAAGAFICADPDDSMGTGTTDEFIAHFGDGNGGTSNTTGISLDTDLHRMSIHVTQSDNWGEFDLQWLLDGQEVRYEKQISNRDFKPWVSVENTGGSRPQLQIKKLVELQYTIPQ